MFEGVDSCLLSPFFCTTTVNVLVLVRYGKEYGESKTDSDSLTDYFVGYNTVPRPTRVVSCKEAISR
jgi:hypothetical protein